MHTFANTVTNTLKPFSTDGCSAVPDFDIVKCCIEHDIAYWQGGTYEQRLEADKDLKQCIADTRDGNILANIFYYGVRVGGGPSSMKHYRWGYGWNYKIGYRELSNNEKKQVQKLYPQNPFELDFTVDDSVERLPSLSGNYCFDEIHNYLRDNFEEEITDIKFSYNKKSSKRMIKTIINNKTTLVFMYKPNRFNKCTKPYYGDTLPKFFYKVKKL